MKPGDQWLEYRTEGWLGGPRHRQISTGRADHAGQAHSGEIGRTKVALTELSGVAFELRTRSAGMAADVDRLRDALASLVGSERAEARALLELVAEFEKAAQLLGVVQEGITELGKEL
ncbi:hypothetical protein [Lentzea sp. NBRC 102530]|uniref:hypothetical protein n=1 Tax=Lentzea sp. NBRC 102530 TaxID=3032201 RepID=UPI0024A3D4BC|nr:hypothetical protein [Lentzea sp. NBRC 102530]GLY53581.1 hypothetical protein Lesp01_72370 [Lentzea sp. NBRC 102530]